MDLITFLITTYNSERWIVEYLNSVINQTYQNLQILIIDDGSSDSTINRIKQMDDERIELFCKEHSGISKSLNFAFNKIKGEFVARIGSDDFCDRDRILRQIEFIKENKDYGIIGTNFYIFYKTGNQIDTIRNPRKHEDIVEQLPRRCCIWDGSVLMRKSIIGKLNGYNELLVGAEDWDFFLRAINITKFYNIQEFLSTKRIHPSSISETETAKQATKDILFNYNNSIIENSKKISEVAKSYFNIGYYYYYESDFLNANEYFRKAIGKGGLNLQLIRYFIFAKYLNFLINFYRKFKLYKMFSWVRYFDKGNKYMRNKF